MPRYTYVCNKCGASTDRTVKLADRDLPVICNVLFISDDSDEYYTEYNQCCGNLQREEIALTARMAHSWLP